MEFDHAAGTGQLEWDLSHPGWEAALREGRSLLPPGLRIDHTAAEVAVNVFNNLRLYDVPGQPLLRDAASEWQRDIIRALFGSVDSVARRRFVQDILLLVPKKNWKTGLGAAIMLTALILNQQPYALFGLFGPTQEVSYRALQAVVGMINADEELPRLLHVREHHGLVVHRLTHAQLKVSTFDPAIATGGNYRGALIDELHLLGKVHHAERTIAQIRGGRTTDPTSFTVFITTQSDVEPAGAFKANLDHARAVRDGEIKGGTFLPILYEFPAEMQADKAKPWRDPATWHMVNPNIGKSTSASELKIAYEREARAGEKQEREWLSQYLNVEIGIAVHGNGWSGAKYWENAGDKAITLEAILERCEVCTIGVDGGGLDDLLGLAVLGRERETNRWLHWGRAWADRGVLDLRKEIAPKLIDLERAGDIAFVDIAETEDGANADVREVVAIVKRIADAGLLPEKAGIGLDAVGVAAIVDELMALDPPLPDGCMVAVPQGYRLSGVIKGAGRKVKDGTLKHGQQPLMAFAVSNAKQEKRGSADLITKQASGTAKIDPLIALFNAFELMSRNPVAAGSVGLYI